MKTWMKYREYLLAGEWHVHTSYTDGKNSVFEMCARAKELGLPLIAFTEHVRKNLSYDFNEFLSDIERGREEFPELIILSGFEAKVLPDCTLDVEKSLFREVDYPIFAFHSFPDDKELYLECLKTVIKHPSINTWAHPGLFIKKMGFNINQRELEEIFTLLKSHSVLLEINKKYQLPPEKWIDLAFKHGVNFVRGSDVHSINSLFGSSDRLWVQTLIRRNNEWEFQQ